MNLDLFKHLLIIIIGFFPNVLRYKYAIDIKLNCNLVIAFLDIIQNNLILFLTDLYNSII